MPWSSSSLSDSRKVRNPTLQFQSIFRYIYHFKIPHKTNEFCQNWDLWLYKDCVLPLWAFSQTLTWHLGLCALFSLVEGSSVIRSLSSPYFNKNCFLKQENVMGVLLSNFFTINKCMVALHCTFFLSSLFSQCCNDRVIQFNTSC